MKSKYAGLFTAKLNDMDLVLFEKHRDWDKWALAVNSDRCFVVSNNFEYFLCLPQHNDSEQCLHWLNGGDVERLTAHQGFLKVGYGLAWSACHEFMNKELEFRVKPKKEKRLIVYRDDVVYGPYLSIDDINTDFVLTGQVVEIEVEV